MISQPINKSVIKLTTYKTVSTGLQQKVNKTKIPLVVWCSVCVRIYGEGQLLVVVDM